VATDDGNEPAPDNIPTAGDAATAAPQEWGHTGVCERKGSGLRNVNVSVTFPRDKGVHSSNTLSAIQAFLFQGLHFDCNNSFDQYWNWTNVEFWGSLMITTHLLFTLHGYNTN
jgi:hypothetical protein